MRFTSWPQHRRSRSSSPSRTILFTFALLVMVLAPIGGQIATAGEDESAQATEEPAVLDPTEEPVDPEGEELDPRPDPTEEPQNELLGSIEIDYWECPDSSNLTEPDLDNLNQDCTGQNGVTFSVSTSDGGSQSQQTGDYGDAHVSFAELPTGMTTINGPGGLSTVWCTGIVQHGGPEIGYTALDASGGTVTWDLQDDEIVFCSWLTVPEVETQGQDTTTRVVIDSYLCLDGVVANASDHDAVLDACPDRLTNVSFTVRNADQEFTRVATADSSMGVTIVEDVPTGDLGIEERVPAGFESPLIYCRLVNEADVALDAPSGYEAISHTNGTFTYTVNDPAKHLSCDIFHFPTPTSATTGAFDIEYRTCPEGYAFLDATVRSQLEIMLADCAVENSIEFALDQPGSNGNPRVTGNDGYGRVVFNGVPAGLRTLRQTSPWGDDNTFVVCEGVSGGTSTGLMLMNHANGMIQWEMKAGQVVSCGWFVGDTQNMPETGGKVTVRYHECPVGTDFATLPESDLATTCTGQADGVVFRTISGGQYDVSAATGDQTTSEVLFTNVVPGLVYVKQVSPVKQLIVICQSNGAVSPPTRMPVSQAQIEWVLQEGETLSCDWYVIPAPGTVTIRTWACGSGADPDMSLDKAVEQCGNFPGLVDFTLTNRSYAQTLTTTDYVASFTQVPPGQVVVGHDTGVSVGAGIVRCETRNLGDDQVIEPWHEVDVTGPGTSFSVLSIALTLGAAQSISCEWYLVPVDWTDDGNARLELSTYACNGEAIPDGTETYEQLITLCAPQTLPVRFVVTGKNDFAKSRTIVSNGFIENIPPGEIHIAPTLPDGTSSVHVFCSGRGIDAKDYELVWGGYAPDETGAIDYTIQADFHKYCSWFLINDPGSTDQDKGYLTVTIDKWICPEGTRYDQDLDAYKTACTQPHAGVDFRITHLNGVANGTTSDVGRVAFDGLPVGITSIQESIPSGYGDPVVSCVLTPTGAPNTIVAGPFMLSTPGGYGTVDPVEDGNSYTITCQWYNIPAGENSVTIWKYACPEWYDPYAWDANPEHDCAESLNGVTFTISGAATELSAQTGDPVDGAVAFSGLPVGTYSVTERLPEGYASAFVWDCWGQRSGELRPSPLAAGTSLTLTLDGGEDVSCRWYNIPAHHDGTLTVIKHTCTTETFVSEVDCEIEEGGVGFDLVWWNGDDWEQADSGITNGSGTLRFTGLDAGEYWLDERGGDWCWLASDNLSDDGNWLDVEAGHDTVVHVYNCGAEPGKPGETPITYPNTGVPPDRDRNTLP